MIADGVNAQNYKSREQYPVCPANRDDITHQKREADHAEIKQGHHIFAVEFIANLPFGGWAETDQDCLPGLRNLLEAVQPIIKTGVFREGMIEKSVGYDCSGGDKTYQYEYL